MSPGDPIEPTEFAKSVVGADADGESTLVAVSSSGGDQKIPVEGTRLGKYELKEKLGTGGMSVVYKAHDLALDRFVALKLLLPQGGSNQIDSMRFQQEAKAASRLEHPNIVKVHDFNITEDGMPYLVMSYLEGFPLSSEIKKEGGLQVGRWLAIMVQACDALSHAHENNVVHRDIKPSNFVLCQEKGQEVLKLVDFGIAKIENNDDQALTKTGEVFGSPLYMSPEQCSGSKVDSRSDVYSLGCVMYEALAGKPPLAGENALATIVKHLQERPQSLTNVCRNIKEIESIDKIVMKCLEKKPEDRYPDTLSVRKELERLFLGLKVTGNASISRIIIALAIAVMTLSAGAVVYTTYLRGNEENEKQAAIILKQTQHEQARALRWTARKNFKEGKLDQARSDLTKALELAIAAKESPTYIAALKVDLGDCEAGAQNRSAARRYYQEVADMPLPLTDKSAVEAKYDANYKLGFSSKYTHINSHDAKGYYLKALEFALMIPRPKPKKLVLLELSKIEEEEGHIAEADSYLKRAQAIQSDDAEVVHAMAEFYGRQKQYESMKKATGDLNRILQEKKKRERDEKARKEKAAAIERESDRQTDLKNENLRKQWEKVVLPPN
ncbi:MAG: hypothetical protein C0469_12315 [Cyanobacteria bacterium DS2.3.42]|nr:hypothetical protein [Cyanobacteria bacterium DS2.3.42]